MISTGLVTTLVTLELGWTPTNVSGRVIQPGFAEEYFTIVAAPSLIWKCNFQDRAEWSYFMKAKPTILESTCPLAFTRNP